MYTSNIAQAERSTSLCSEQESLEVPLHEAPGWAGPFRAIACGNALQGDWGVALYALEALRQEGLGQEASFEYIASEYHYLLYALHEAKVAVVALPACVSGHVGMIRAWSWTRLAEYVKGGGSSWELRALAQAAASVELAYSLPPELLFLIIETQANDAVGLSPQGRSLARKTVRLILDYLARHGLAAARRKRNEHKLYRVPWLQIAF